MKTIKEIDQEIIDLFKEYRKCEEKKRPRIESKIVFRRKCKLYLETNPRPEYLTSQKELLTKQIEHFKTQFDQWQIGRCLSTYKDSYATYLKEMGVPELKSKLATIDYLLS